MRRPDQAWPHPRTTGVRAGGLLLLLVVLLVSSFAAASPPPRLHSRVAVYRPVEPAYHSYASYKGALRSVAADTRHRPTLRIRASEERTRAGEKLYLAQLGHWHKDEAGGPLPAAISAGGSEAQAFFPPSTPRTPSRKLRVLFSFGEHAREHITIESGLHLLHSLLEGAAASHEGHCALLGADLELDLTAGAPSESQQRANGARLAASAGFQARFASFVLDHAEVHLLGCTNPDGKLHLERTGDFCWRNTGANVDLNRNADWEFGKEGSSPDPAGEEYHGPHPFSETETRFLRDLVREYRYDAYVSVHSGEQQLFVPFVDTESRRIARRRPETDAELALCQRVVRHPHLGGWLHDSGLGYEQNDYSADGTLSDYFAGKEHVPRVFCVELYGGPTHDDCFVQFNPAAEERPAVHAHSGLPRMDAQGRPVFSSPLRDSLARMHVFYVRMLSELIAEHYGVEYRDPAEIADPQARKEALQRAKTLCEIEAALYKHKERMQTQQAQHGSAQGAEAIEL